MDRRQPSKHRLVQHAQLLKLSHRWGSTKLQKYADEVASKLKEQLRGMWRYRWSALVIAWVVAILGWAAVFSATCREHASWCTWWIFHQTAAATP